MLPATRRNLLQTATLNVLAVRAVAVAARKLVCEGLACKGGSAPLGQDCSGEGALAGATPKDAFFVRCGLGTTMNAQDLLEGRMIVEIGMAIVRPAEFIILKVSHELQAD